MKPAKPKSKRPNIPASKPVSPTAVRPTKGARKASAQEPTAARRSARDVTVRIYAPTAVTVCVAGTFNDWKVGAHPLRLANGGEWRGDLSLMTGRYEYLFVVDGSWLPDPAAGENIPNEFGGLNSVLLVN